MSNIKVTYLVKNIFRADNRLVGFTDNHLLLLVYLQKFTTYSNQIYFVFDFMFTDLNIGKTVLRSDLFKCLDDLNNWGLINITNDIDFKSINKNTIIIIDKVNYESNYTVLYAEEVNKILYSDMDIRSKKTLLYLYSVIVSWIGINGRQYCFPRREQLKDDIQTTSNQRIIDGIKQLKKLGLIDYASAGIVKNDNKFYQVNNVYVVTYLENYQEILSQAIDESKYYYEVADIEVLHRKKKEVVVEEIEEVEEPSTDWGESNPMKKPLNIGRKSKSFTDKYTDKFLQSIIDDEDISNVFEGIG